MHVSMDEPHRMLNNKNKSEDTYDTVPFAEQFRNKIKQYVFAKGIEKGKEMTNTFILGWIYRVRRRGDHLRDTYKELDGRGLFC